MNQYETCYEICEAGRTNPTAADTADPYPANRAGRTGGPARRGPRPTATVLVAAVMLLAAGGGADAIVRSVKPTPVAKAGPRAAALVVPSGTDVDLTPTLERNSGFRTVYQPARGIYCFVTTDILRNPVPSMTPDAARSGDAHGVVEWLSDPTGRGCRANEIGAMTLVPDGPGALVPSNRVAFAIVVD